MPSFLVQAALFSAMIDPIFLYSVEKSILCLFASWEALPLLNALTGDPMVALLSALAAFTGESVACWVLALTNLPA